MSPAGAGTPSETGGSAPAGLRALVVDDEPPLVKVVSSYLEREGFEVASAGDGERAVALAREFEPDVIVLDLMLPGLDGIEACRQIRANPETADIPVLMFSALSGDEDVERARLAGANHLITKPFNLVGLGSVVKSFFASDSPIAV